SDCDSCGGGHAIFRSRNLRALLGTYSSDPQGWRIYSGRNFAVGIRPHRDCGGVLMSSARVNSLAFSFQEVLTAILRVRFQRQQVQDAESFRAQMKRSLQSAMQDAKTLGYTSETVQLAVFAAVAYLDESVLNLQSPVFADWARRPLQVELFGDN